MKVRIYGALAVLVLAGLLASMSGGLGLNWPSDTKRLPGCDRSGEHNVTVKVRLTRAVSTDVKWSVGPNKGNTVMLDTRHLAKSSIVECGDTVSITAQRNNEGYEIQCEILADGVRLRYREERPRDCHLEVELP